MRKATFLSIVLSLGAVAAIATGQATTMPSASASSVPPVVLVAPFQQLGDITTHGWVSSALQEDLLASIARGNLQAKSSDKTLSGSDTAAAVQVGHDADANFIITGSFQIVGEQLRVNAQTTNVDSGRVVGSMQSSGQIRDLFAVEDALASQLRTQLPNMGAAPLPAVTYGAHGSPYAYLSMTPSSASTSSNGTYSMFGPSTAQDNLPQTSSGPDDSSNDSAYAPAYYPYGYGYGYGYPFSSTIVIIRNHHHHDHDHDGHFHPVTGTQFGGQRTFNNSSHVSRVPVTGGFNFQGSFGGRR